MSEPAVASHAGQRRTRWRLPWAQLVAALTIVAGAGVFLYPQTAAWYSQRSQSRVIENSVTTVDESLDARNASLQLADRYNQTLASGASLGANTNVPSGSGTSSDSTFVYEDILATSDDGVMGRLKYDALDIDLPIYHGTSDETLLKGVGHLEGTSLPVGGVDSRAVLTAHRGLANATMFNNLVDAAVGDIGL